MSSLLGKTVLVINLKMGSKDMVKRKPLAGQPWRTSSCHRKLATTLTCVFDRSFDDTKNCFLFKHLKDPAVVNSGASTRKVSKEDAVIVPIANMLSVVCHLLMHL